MTTERDDTIRRHPAYVDHTDVDSYEGFTLVRVTYREDHPDYEGGEHLEVWDDNEEYLHDVEDQSEFWQLVDDVLAEREEAEREDDDA
jgi:hypothetical protein